MEITKVWFITGASQGLGLFLVKKLLDRGDKIAATSRNIQALQASVGETKSDQFLALTVNLNDGDSIKKSVQETIAAFGRIDVLVNNAGYGPAGAAEDISEADIRNIFEVNVLAVFNVTKSILPVMRNQGSGHIINMSSILAFSAAPGWSAYSATKAAVSAFSEVLALDVEEFGIKVTIVEPSGFRTNFLSGGSLVFRESKIDGYKAVKETHQRYLLTDGKQAGDPGRATDIIIATANEEKPPLHLFLGKNAYDRASIKLQLMTKEVEALKSISVSVDFQEQ
ncbi:NADP-dependent 3-hydroxy acid dehydrogenase YdfG [Mucilaginibacter mallensis]|uniref:NADP-dependent 3-hydroxy acid dehydrogenase YdfG n=1 Tax=Mucilaginibacter mallensis TaxID=652787 RepID=A0A1H1SRG2_MUCMA|nr:SDR family oxidoreductase [Mucilaginibacter mallensis]SDS50448.1 NADP-dependent 3-hydroxy acid dehydrogenase YdfG [Mucilaginibacter mallensis]